MRNEIISKALSYVGLTYDNDNNIVFVTDYYGHKTNRKIAYCAMFVWDVMRMCGAAEYYYNGAKTASCTALLNYYKKKHPTWVHKNLDRCKPGDLIFFQFDEDKRADHVGFYLDRVTTNYFYTCEGNTSRNMLGSQSNGGYVERKKRHIKKVMAFVSLNMPEDKNCPYMEPITTVCKGKKGNDASWVQWWLNEKGYPCDIDGSFGAKSVKALEKFQAEYYPDIYHLEVDGRCGPATRKVLKT